MSRNYKFHNPEGLYFVSFAVVHWIDVFTRSLYSDIFLETMKFYQKDRLDLYAYCVMSNHVHLIFADRGKRPELLLGNIKRYSSRKIREEIEQNAQESRKDWMLWIFKRAGERTSNIATRDIDSRGSNSDRYMFWQHHNQPIELWSKEVIEQKLNYIHQNPVKA